MKHFRQLFLGVYLIATPVIAQGQDAYQLLADAMRLPEIIEVMRAEGLDSSSDLATNMLGGVTDRFLASVDQIYDTDRMELIVMNGLSQGLNENAAETAASFFQSELGAQIISLEISARLAFGDVAIEEASNEVAKDLPRADPERFDLLSEYISVNNLIENNVVGALNSNLAFFEGLVEGGAFDRAVSEDEMLAEVAAQEAEIRADTELWLQSYLALAYQPLSDEELGLYIDFSGTGAGQALNRALFEGFDEMFVNISRALGLTVGSISGAEQL